MQLTRWEYLSTGETLARLRQVRLRGFGAPLVYARSTLSLEQAVPADSLVPAQRYVLKANLDRVLMLARLFAQERINIFALEGVLLFWLDQDGLVEGPTPIAPPVVEESHEANGRVVWLINDGMHRVTVALRIGVPINILLVRAVPTEWPYYALPLPGGWADVEDLDRLPTDYRKKTYRRPGDKKALFRDFNAVFPGIQKKREAS
ncbi:hypothetical protein RIEGSTA812A_PEG_756 [invertebrate metagenome]|uniref:ParB-like catalytic effector domain-containing protein n=1 Tax=invertebrate metagenome TaxID=1711999 RepID=A0A484H8Z2_9ZZZZ